MGFDYALVISEDPKVDLDVARDLATDELGGDDLAWIVARELRFAPKGRPVSAFAFRGPQDTRRGLLKIDLGDFAAALAKRTRKRVLAAFLAEHYSMSGYRLYDRGLGSTERIYWDGTRARFAADFDYNTLPDEGLAELGINLPRSATAALPRAYDRLCKVARRRWYMLRRGEVLDEPELIKSLAGDEPTGDEPVPVWSISFEATHGLVHVMRSLS